MAKISAEPPCVADQSIPINSHKCEEEKVSSEGKYSFVSFLFLFPYFLMHTHTVYFFLPYPHAQGLCLEGKKILFFLLLCPCTRFFSFLIIHMHEVSLQHNFFLERHTHIFYLHCPWHRRPLSLPPAFRPLHRHPRTPAPLSTAGAHVSLSLASPLASVRFCSSHQCPYPPAPIDLLTTDDVPYRFVVDEGNVLHSIRMLCFP